MVTIGSDCVTGKWQFATKDAAKAIAAQTRRLRGWRMHAYQCPFCRCYHIANRRPASSKSRRR